MSLAGRTFRAPADQTVDYYKIGSSRPTWTRTKPSGTDRADIFSFQSYIHIFGFKWEFTKGMKPSWVYGVPAQGVLTLSPV